MGGKGWGSSLQERDSHTYTFRLSYTRISILYKKKYLLLSQFINPLIRKIVVLN